MSDYLLIGPVLLQDFELPERISWGGAQRLAVHRLPGGRRVIDSMGRDDADITWTGVFSGADAGLRARTLDLMRADGGLWPLTWGSYFYSVVVARFDAEYARANWIPYRIICTVLRDETEALVEGVVSLAGGVLGDVAAAAGLGAGLDLASVQQQLEAPGALRYGTVAHGQALGGLRAGEAALGAGLAAAGVALLGADAGTGAGVRAASDRSGELAALARARGPLGRARAGLESVRD